jgi:hypothetical protein
MLLAAAGLSLGDYTTQADAEPGILGGGGTVTTTATLTTTSTFVSSYPVTSTVTTVRLTVP